MEELGVVVQEKNSTVLVRAKRGTSCDSCSAKSSCHADGATEALIEAENNIGAKVGDNVVFSVAAGSVIKAGMLLYLGPVLSFIFGVVIGQAVLKDIFTNYNPDLISAVTGVVFLGIAFFGLRLFSRYARNKSAFMPQILRKI